MLKLVVSLSAATLFGSLSANAAGLELNRPDAKEMLRVEHGQTDGLRLADGRLTLVPAPGDGLRIGIADAAVPADGYNLSGRIAFPTGAVAGHAGFQVRRADGKTCYVHLAPDGSSVAISGATEKLLTASLPPPPPGGHHLAISVGPETLDVSVDGQYCFSLDKLPGKPGGAAFFTYKTPVEYSEFSLVPPPVATLVPPPNALFSDDFARPAASLKRLALLHGAKENFSVTPGVLELRDAGAGSGICVQFGGPEGLDDFKLAAEVLAAPGNGHGGFQLRRDGGKLVYVFLTAGNRAVGAAQKNASLPQTPPGTWARLEVECVGGTATVSVDGKQYLVLDKLSAREGAVCVASFGCDIKFRNVVITPR